MIEAEKIYLCTTTDPNRAALLYDVVILQVKGFQAKVNFTYTKEELLSILFHPSIIEIKSN